MQYANCTQLSIRLRFAGFMMSSLLFTLFTGCASGTDGGEEKIQRYETGTVSRRYYLVNGLKEGIMTDYYPDGKIMAQRMFSNDLQDGRTVLYHPGGQLQEVQYFEKGARVKADSIWYQGGQLQFVCEFLDGKKHGYLRKWSQQGDLVFEAKYLQDSVIEINGQAAKVPAILDIPN